MLAVWAEVFGFKGSFKTIIGTKNGRADLAKYLVFYFAVVVVQVNVRRVTEGALFGLWDGSATAKLDGFEWSAVFGLISFEDCLEV
jgi:hypothetical protein